MNKKRRNARKKHKKSIERVKARRRLQKSKMKPATEKGETV
ncbi:MAG: hypothetical protein OEV30_10465 [Ignavibacteria bacterium]|nr:hypothetical protein [Ignavibacteria bacterium]